MNLPVPKKLLSSELWLIADMRGIKVKKTLKKNKLFKILKKYDKKKQ